MNIDEINEREKAENYINALIDNYKQDIKGTLYQKLNQEDVRDFLVNFYIDVTKKLEKENKVLAQNLEDTEIINNTLEKEKAELKKEVEKHKWNNIFLEDCAVYDKKIAEEYTTLQERIKRLEKENAELKKQLEHRNCVDCSNHGSNIKLLKAKEIIKNLLFLHNDKFGSTRLEWRCNVVAEAEQFLSEVEK